MYCLEANTLPGMTPTSLIPQEAAALGMDYPTLCEHLIEVSLKKYEWTSNGSASDINKRESQNPGQLKERLPFGGGSGAGVSISPIAFIVVQANGVKLLPVEHSSCMDKLLDLVPDLAEKLSEMLGKTVNSMKLGKLEKEAIKNGANSEVKITNTSSGTTTEIKKDNGFDVEYDETDM